MTYLFVPSWGICQFQNSYNGVQFFVSLVGLCMPYRSSSSILYRDSRKEGLDARKRSEPKCATADHNSSCA